MRRSALDVVLLLALLTLWVGCTVLHVRQVANGRLAWVGVYVNAPADDGFPSVRGFWPGAPTEASGALAIGDRLLRAGGVDLRGAGPFDFVARVQASASGRHLRVPIRYERSGVARDTTIELVPVAFPWRILPLCCALVATGALVLVRRRG